MNPTRTLLGAVVIILTTLSLVLAVSPVFSAEVKTGGVQPRYGGTLKLSDLGEGVSIGYPPKMLKNTFCFREAMPAIETLLRSDVTGKPIPWLATDYKENAKANTITLILRKGVKFHDGTDFNADAVKWNLEQHIAAKTAGTEKFKSIDAVDDYTVRITLSTWDSTVTSNFAQFLGMIISPAAYKKNGEEWAAKNPVGTGPFQLVSWEKDVRCTYRKFEGYWQKGKPYLDRIEFIPIIDSLTRELSLRKGEIDVMLTLTAKNLASLEKEGNVITRRTAGSGARALVPDSANPNSPFADVRVRKAVKHAIDSEAIVKSVFNNELKTTNQYISNGHWAYNPSVIGYPYYPERVKQLLAEAGYPSGFKTKLVYLTNRDNDEVFAAVQGYLGAVGIDVQLDPAQIGRWNQVLTGAKWEGLWMGQSSANPDIVVPLVLFYSGGPAFTQMAVPDDYLKTIQKAVAADDFEAKQKAAQEIMKLMIDKYALIIPLYCIADFTVSKRYVHNTGFGHSPNTGIWTPEEAWLDR